VFMRGQSTIDPVTTAMHSTRVKVPPLYPEEFRRVPLMKIQRQKSALNNLDDAWAEPVSIRKLRSLPPPVSAAHL
jgi:hypothetical protein